MGPPTTKQWDRALQEMVRRWRLILEKIDLHDEGAILALANMMDEFCEVAVMERRAASSDRDDPAVPVLKFPPDDAMRGRCVFCRAFVSLGGCFGPLHALNKAVLERRWAIARRVAEEHLDRLRTLDFSRQPGGTVH